jgi:site-specific DNA recombinase
VRVERADLRIVSEELWSSVVRPIAAKTHMGRARPSGTRARYLLSGFSKCGVCGGRMQVGNGKASHTPIKVYACASHRDRGTCDNSLRRPVEAVDAVVLDWISRNVLSEEVVAKCLREVRHRIAERSTKTASELPALEKRANQLKREIDRLGEALLASSDPPSKIVQMMSAREKELGSLNAQINTLKIAPSVLDLEIRRLEKEARERLRDLRSLLGRHPDRAREVLEALLTGPLVFQPIETAEGKRYRVEAEASLDRAVSAGGAGCSMTGVPSGIRTRVPGMKTLCPGPD